MTKEKKEIEVYLGQGETIKVTPNDKVTYYLDMEKLKEYFEKNPKNELTVGAETDWSWTAQTIKGKEEFEKIEKGEENILRASCWDKFTINQEEDCTVEVPNNFNKLALHRGFYDGIYKIEQWFSVKIYNDLLKNMKYEMIKEMQAEINPILKKYKNELEVLKKYSNNDKKKS